MKRKVMKITKCLNDTVLWTINKKTYKCQWLPNDCPKCNKQTLVALPPPIRDIQPDKTNVVCLSAPAFGGCNHGFEMKSVSPEVLACELHPADAEAYAKVNGGKR